MSQLPKGTLAARNFIDSVAVQGAMASLIAWAPPLGWPVLKDIVQACIEHELVDPTLDELTALAIAGKYVIDRHAFDYHFLKLKTIDQATPADQEAAIVEAEKAIFNLVRRGPVS